MKTKSILLGLLVAAGCSAASLASESNQTDRLVIHEWGTFTVLQDESGSSVPGVNINEETLPDFVHRLANGLAPDSHELGPLLNTGPYGSRFLRSKGVPRFYPAVTMRMETPIIYFYPPAGSRVPLHLDVEVQFRCGWISEWFPHAYNDAPGFEMAPNETFAGKLGPETVGRIRWAGLQVGAEGGAMPETQEHVWLAPRNVPAAAVRNRDGESERYLFYRGVANLEAPLRVTRTPDHRLELHPNPRSLTVGASQKHLPVRSLWLADIRADGQTAFRPVAPIDLNARDGGTVPSIPATFAKEDYRSRSELRASMRRAIIADGLYEPEADALLNTWEASYFKTPGLRLFFLTPRAWTEAVLPLSVSSCPSDLADHTRPRSSSYGGQADHTDHTDLQSADICRVMIGRIELVTPEQRALVARIAASPSADLSWFSEPFDRIPENERATARRELLAGRRTLADFGIRMPDSYRCYLALGRFRDALVLDAVTRENPGNLYAFADTYGLRYFKSTL